MANELRVNAGLVIKKGNVQYASQPTAFVVTLTATVVGGPTPGAFIAAVLGTDVDLSQLSTPGWGVIKNLDDTNYVTIGVRDPETNKFYPIHELLPGEIYPCRFSRMLGWEYGTGTGTSGPETNVLCIRADTAPCWVSVEAFEN